MAFEHNHEGSYSDVMEAKQEIIDCIESSLALAGYEIMTGNAESLVVRSAVNDLSFQISIAHLPG